VRPSGLRAHLQVRLAAIPVGNRPFSHHPLAVLQSALRKRPIPPEWTNSSRLPSLIAEYKKLLRGSRN
jgi:hypothetical protein